VTCFSRKRIFGYGFVAGSSIMIALLGFLVWAHHMFVAGISVYSAMIFSFLSYMVAVPSAIKVFNWTATLYKGSVSFDTPMLYGLGFIGLFTIGGLTGLFVAALGVDVAITEADVRIVLPATLDKLNAQASVYRQAMAACLAVPRCVSFTVWGFSDRYSWIPSLQTGAGAACLFDSELHPKGAYAAVVDTLAK